MKKFLARLAEAALGGALLLAVLAALLFAIIYLASS